MKTNKVASEVVNAPNIASAIKPISVAKIVASLLLKTPVASGRLAVRFINLSDSDSITILNAFALPAARVPPIKVAIVSESDGSPFCAKTIAGRVETNKSSTTRSFIRST